MRIIRFLKRFFNQRRIHKTFSLLTIIKIAWIQSKAKKDESVIPKGFYCYDWVNGKRKACPYWSINKNRPEQFNGYCSFLEKGDIEINKKTIWEDSRTGEVQTAEDIGLPMSLLWDMVKECEINECTDEEIEDEFFNEVCNDNQE